eukprot:CAMPEP_0115364326 /NCGR_PEP_ID=MMETSP0270-20121206/103710_1 /TAXON_ID=71861 /ORGANISM="Scrippsiella trochoidea, Strain CCMP3099" /LENGTH=64 /DNA_ID=CAMNT_0002787019 /DNA_START=337 /DNA_END=529 /DNA_ORIENTATION=+
MSAAKAVVEGLLSISEGVRRKEPNKMIELNPDDPNKQRYGQEPHKKVREFQLTERHVYGGDKDN